MFGIAPAVSSTGIMIGSYEFFCSLPHQKYGPSCTLASSSSRPFTGDCHEIWFIMLGWFVLVEYASGERIDAPNPRPVPSPPCSHAMQEYCVLCQKLILLRVVSWYVRRRLPCFQMPSLIACWLVSGT